MAKPWELVLHHTFAGTPGVVFDHSPTRRCHGQPVNLAAADFLSDGATSGSGAVRFHSGSTMIRVPPSPSWQPLGGVRIEMTCETDLIRTGGPLVTADSFSFNTDGGYFGGSFSQTHGGSSAITEGGSGPRPLPANRWMTLTLQYDPAGVYAAIDGVVVNEWIEWNGMLAGTSGLIIGNDLSGQHGLTGLIDDIKVWRVNPHRIGDTFVERPIDTAVGRCWAEWSRRLDEVIKSNRECWDKVTVLLPRALLSMLNELARLPGVQPRFVELAQRYQELWSQGRLDEVSTVLSDMIVLLRDAGFDPAQLAEVQELLNDSCLASLTEQLPINCDAKFTSMFEVSETF